MVYMRTRRIVPCTFPRLGRSLYLYNDLRVRTPRAARAPRAPRAVDRGPDVCESAVYEATPACQELTEL